MKKNALKQQLALAQQAIEDLIVHLVEYADQVDELEAEIAQCDMNADLLEAQRQHWEESYNAIKRQFAGYQRYETMYFDVCKQRDEAVLGETTWLNSYRDLSETHKQTISKLQEAQQRNSTVQQSATFHMNEARRYELEMRVGAETIEQLRKSLEMTQKALSVAAQDQARQDNEISTLKTSEGSFSNAYWEACKQRDDFLATLRAGEEKVVRLELELRRVKTDKAIETKRADYYYEKSLKKDAPPAQG